MVTRACGVRWRALAVLLLAFAASSLPSSFGEELRPWNDYRAIMWIGGTAYEKPDKLPLFFQRLKEMGINTAMVHHEPPTPALLESGLPFYVENLVNKGLCLKFSSKVTDWEKHVTAWKGTRDEGGLVRDYSLNDPEWRKWASGEMQRLVKATAAHQPIAYDIRDELSTTLSANPFDYDFAPVALAGFRDWLKGEYRDLAALNAEWETRFATWEEVKPFTTDQIKNRMASGDALPRGNLDWQAVQKIGFDITAARNEPTKWNFAPWADHRSYMDSALSDALGMLRESAHALDPKTPVGIEGTQMPSAFGGYDLWKLSRVLDWVEPYDIGNAREIWGSFMSGKPMMTTVGEQDANSARRRLWHLLLEGDRGCIVWWSEDCIDWKSADYQLTPRAKALAPVLQEMSSPLARLFMRAEREFDPIAIHYSQASIQVNWLLESTGDGSTWLRRFSSYEAQHNRLLRVRDAWLKMLQDLGFSPRFVSTAQIENGELLRSGCRALVMPQSLAVSDKEAAAIRTFLFADATPRFLVSDGAPGLFDEHARLRAKCVFEDLLPAFPSSERAVVRDNSAPDGEPLLDSHEGDISTYPQERGKLITTDWNAPENKNAESWTAWLGRFQPVKSKAPQQTLIAPIRVPPAARVGIFRYRLSPGVRLAAFERNISYQMSEDLKQTGGNESLEKAIDVEARLATPAHAYDLRTGKYLGRTDKLPVHIDPWQPSLFALCEAKLPDGDVLAELAKRLPRQ